MKARTSPAPLRSNDHAAGDVTRAALGDMPITDSSPISSSPERRPRPRKIRGTFSLTSELLEQVRDAVFHLSGPPLRLTMASLAETAIMRELARLKLVHNRGKDFPRRGSELRGGRPLGSPSLGS